ncbi:MAG: hypothetical protein Kow00117_20130 [Phototrophicales bacterium]
MSNIEYIQHPNGIHEFIWQEPVVETIKEWLEKLEEIYEAAAPNSLLMFLIDALVTISPEATYQHIQQFRAKQSKRLFTRTAVLYNTAMPPQDIRRVENIFNRETDIYRVFNPNKRNEAIKWLLA